MNNFTGSNSQQPAQGVAQGGEQKQDFLDKAFDFGSKKAGKDFDRGTDEKITDGIRGAFEKATGKKTSDKISN